MSGGPPPQAVPPAPVPPDTTPSASLPAEVRSVLERLPPQQREVIERSFAMMVQSGPLMNPIYNKIDGEHLHKMFDGIENDNKRMYEDRVHRRSSTLRVAIVAGIAFIVLCGMFLWANQTGLLKDVIGYVAAFFGGIGVGRLGRRQP